MPQSDSLGINETRLNDDSVVPKLGGYYHLTSAFRILPSAFIAGVQKGGTTSLCNYLYQHPEVIPAQRKDVFYFNNPIHYAKGLGWYRAHFAMRAYKRIYDRDHGTDAITIDSTPNYFEAPGAAERLHNDFPNAKLIFLLRNPVDRAWSNYQMAKKFGFETLSFEEALDLEEKRLQEEEKKIAKHRHHNYVFQRLSYRKRGIYVNYLPQWLKLFPKENILIIKSEDLFEGPRDVFDKVTDFLNLKSSVRIRFENFNPGGYSEGMNAETRKQLSEFYEPYNQELYKLLNVNYGWE